MIKVGDKFKHKIHRDHKCVVIEIEQTIEDYEDAIKYEIVESDRRRAIGRTHIKRKSSFTNMYEPTSLFSKHKNKLNV